MNAKEEMEAQVGLYRGIEYVGGRGYGKKLLMAKIVGPMPTVAELEGAIDITGYTEGFEPSFPTPYDSPVKYPPANFEAKFLGNWANWAYTPAEELRDRLNDRIQGKQPALAINTRYWRGL